MMNKQADTEELQSKVYQCSHCVLKFEFKFSLFKHLNTLHGFNVDAALRGSGLKFPKTDEAKTDSTSESQHCDLNTSDSDVSNKHEEKCDEKMATSKGNLIISANPETKIQVISANSHLRVAEVIFPSKSKGTVNLSKDLKTYKNPSQTITKDLASSSGSTVKPPFKSTESLMLRDISKGTLILQESPLSSSPNSSGVFKVTATSMIDISTDVPDRFLIDENLYASELAPVRSKRQFESEPPDDSGKRVCTELSRRHPVTNTKKEDKEKKRLPGKHKAGTQQSSSITKFSFEVSEDDDEKRVHIVYGNSEIPKMYFCKLCDYSDEDIQHVSTHYQNNHPYVLYNSDYIRNLKDQSATFRCLICPVEFLTVSHLKKHYAKNHEGDPDVFKLQLSELSLVFKCFVCPFTNDALNALKEHYKENHPKHNMDNSFMFLRYLAPRCQEGSSKVNECEKTPSLKRSPRITSLSGSIPCEEVNSAPLSQPPTTKAGADVSLYQCRNCAFSHKSVVVMHVHYQKCHPEEAVTIDKIKKSKTVTSQAATPEKTSVFPSSVTTTVESTPEKKTCDSSKKEEDRAETSQEILIPLMNPKLAPEASKSPSKSPKTKKGESAEDKHDGKEMVALSPHSPNTVFYCQFCSYSSTNVKSVVCHHNTKHAANAQMGIKEILKYNDELQSKGCQSEAEASGSVKSSDSKSSKQVRACNENVPNGINAYARAEDLFYCETCNYGNPSVKGVTNHRARAHSVLLCNRESVLEYTALIREQIEKSKLQATDLPFSTNLPLPVMSEGDENKFFCHLCNYRQSSINSVARHYYGRHPGSEVKMEKIRQHTSWILKQTGKFELQATDGVNPESIGDKEDKKKQIKMCGKPSSVSGSSSAQMHKTLRCQRCTYSTQHVRCLRRHMWNIHKSHHSATDLLRHCSRDGKLHHCDLCAFSHQKTAVLNQHYQEQHPATSSSLEFVATQLNVGCEISSPEKKTSKRKHMDGVDDDGTDGPLPSQRSNQSETRKYSCRACSFKVSSLVTLTDHYRAVHPWSVKEDGSVLDVNSRKKPSANRHGEDRSESLRSFDDFQQPLEFDSSPGSSHEASASSAMLSCSECPLAFSTQHGLKTHLGMKHPNADNEQNHTRVHVFKCPHCPYVNTSHQGAGTHCRMRHPALPSEVESVQVAVENSQDWNSGDILTFSGYVCEFCPIVRTSLKWLKWHCEKVHNETVPNTSKKATKPSTVRKIQLSKTVCRLGSLSKASLFRRKFSQRRRMLGQHKNASGSYNCVLCSNAFFTKKLLGCHYRKKHGKGAYLKYYVSVQKQVSNKQALYQHPLRQKPQDTSEACNSGAETDKRIVFTCPNCPYVNTSFHGTLTHCQMKHPEVTARAEELLMDEILVTNLVRCTLGRGSNERGYVCHICPQIHASLWKLKVHCEKDHAAPLASAHSAEIETESRPLPEDDNSHGSVLEAASLQNKKSADPDLILNPPVTHYTGSQGKNEDHVSVYQQKHKEARLPSPDQAPETPLDTQSVQTKDQLYKCHICPYIGSCRRYLAAHYKNGHKYDSFSTSTFLQKYNKRKGSNNSAQMKCKKCPDLLFNSSQRLIAHYSRVHGSDCHLDFTVLYRRSRRHTGTYVCGRCKKQLDGIRNLCQHLDHHRESDREAAAGRKTLVTTATPTAESSEPFELPVSEALEEPSVTKVTQEESFTSPTRHLSTPSKPADEERPEPEDRKEKHTCGQCPRTFMSLKGLLSHRRSHAAFAAIKKQNSLPTSLEHNIDKNIVYKSWTKKPFVCTICSYRTSVMGLWLGHFKRNHKNLMDASMADKQDEVTSQRSEEELPNSSDELINVSDEEPEVTEKSLYLEPPDVQRQLNHISSIAQKGSSSKANMQETKSPDSSLLHCVLCSFSTGHLSSLRRHYYNRHGKRMIKCKDCSFFTCFKKAFDVHLKLGHSTPQPEPPHHKDLHCPFCLYQTKNKNSMIEHIILHREERVEPIEVRRPKLSRYLEGIVFRCHKCTFTSASAENLRVHMMRHDDIKPYKCRLCFFDCTQLCHLEAHLCDNHQVVRNHELVGQVNLDQLEARTGRVHEEEEQPLSNHNDSEDVETNEEPCQKLRLDGRKESEGSLTQSSALDIQQENNANTLVQETLEQDPQEQNEMFLTDMKEMNHSDLQKEDCNVPNKVRQMNVNQPRGYADSRIMIKEGKEGAAEGSSSKYSKVDRKAFKLQNKVLQNKTLEERVEDDILRQVLQMDEDGSSRYLHKKVGHDRTVVKKQDVYSEVVNVSQIIFQDQTSSFTLPHNPKDLHKVKMGVIQIIPKKNHKMKNNIKTQECFKAESKDHKQEEGDGIKETDNPPVLKGPLETVDTTVAALCSTVTEKSFKCEFCGRNLLSHPELERHIKRHGM